MFKKISLLVFLSIPLMVLADDHENKGDDSHENINEMEMKEKKRAHMIEQMEKRGMWKPEDCKKVSDSSGAFLYYSGLAIDASEKLEKEGKQEASDEKAIEALALAELAANFAKNYEAYCKK